MVPMEEFMLKSYEWVGAIIVLKLSILGIVDEEARPDNLTTRM